MLWSNSSRRYRLRTALVLALGLAASLWAPAARAQIAPGDGVPTRVYFGMLPLYFDGDYREALAGFQSNGGIKTPNGRWIDSICYFAMAGESYNQLGQLKPALDSYTEALKLYLAYSDWMMRVQFPQAIMPATSGAARACPWGQSRRGARVGQFPETFLMGQGRLDNTNVLIFGGAVQNPVLFPVHAAEIVRCTCLAIRRRAELLGPIAKYDALSSSVVDALSRHPGPPNHWSQAWINVELGCAFAAAGNSAQAHTTLEQSLLVGGEFDHPLTSTALVELGRLALEAADFPAAGRYFEEATYACVNYPNPSVLEEAFRLGVLSHQLQHQKVPYPPLMPAIAWAKLQGTRHLQASLLLSGAETMSDAGDAAQASNLLAAARAVVGRGDLSISHLGARMNHLTALASYQTGNLAAGDAALTSALAFQRSGSLWMFQILLADSRFLSGEFSDRIGISLYEVLLRDPGAGDWLWSPLEALSVLSTPHGAALEHWFEAVIKNTREQDLALEIADRARRHRFFSTLPMGGRLLALRWIMEGPAELLGERGLLQRQDLLAHYPRYAQLAQQATELRTKLTAKPIVAEALDARRQQAAELTELAEISHAQEIILHEIAVRREPAEMVFPPLRKTKDVQRSLGEGQVLLAFFATSRNLYAFLYSHEKYAAWHINSPTQLQKNVAALLRELGNFDANHEVPPADLAKNGWRATSARVLSLLLEKSNVDLAGNFDEIAIVPDGYLWYLPFETLYVGKGEHQKPLIEQARVRYAPTVGLAIPYGRAQKQHPNVGVVLGKMFPHDDDSVTAGAFEQLAHSVNGAVALPRSLAVVPGTFRVLMDGLIVLDDIQPSDHPYDWAPVSLDRTKSGASLASWFSLPWGAPEHVLLPGFHTAAENGLKRGQPSGNEMFLALCGLMSSGTRTVLISRWRAGGQTSFDLIREFAQELPHVSPAEAWQRSVQVAVNTPIEPEHEPRIKKGTPGADVLKAEHPFFWAGYMLVDPGTVPPGEDKLLAIPGLDAPKKAMPANPPPVPGRPAVGNPPMADPAAAEPPAEKPSKGAKNPPRGSAKKAPRQKPAPRAESE